MKNQVLVRARSSGQFFPYLSRSRLATHALLVAVYTFIGTTFSPVVAIQSRRNIT